MSMSGNSSEASTAQIGDAIGIDTGKGFYRGWWMVALGFLCIAFASSAAPATLPLIYGEVMKEFGWTRTEATMIFTYKQVASSAIALFLVGPMIERFSLRFVMIFLCVCTALGMASFLWIDGLWSYYLSGFLFGMGGTTIVIPIKLLVSRWFNRNQGLAVGMVMLGMSVGGIIFPVAGNYLIDAIGWRAAFASLSLGIWLLALPLYIWKANDKPTPADLLREAAAASPDPAATERLRAADLDMGFWDVLRTPMFWLIAVGLFFVGLVDAGMIQHTILYMKEEAGLSTQVAAWALSSTFVVGVAAKLVAGKTFDLLSIRGIQIWYLLLAVAIGMVFLVQDFTTAMIFSVVRGIAHGGLVVETAVIAKHCYGPKLLNRTMPVMTGFYGFGAALGPLILSVMHDSTGSYSAGFALFAVLSLVSAVLLLGVRPIYRERLKAIS
jgi:OFA family oxalate/formate antiporter-like MFS transporter